jgi:hypothetical protein
VAVNKMKMKLPCINQKENFLLTKLVNLTVMLNQSLKIDAVINGKAASSTLESPKHDEAKPKLEPTAFISFDWENEGPYEKAIERWQILQKNYLPCILFHT